MRNLSDHYLTNPELIAFRQSVTMDISLFINTICNLYGDFSDAAAHKINFPVPYDRDSISRMFEDLGITPDESKLSVVETVLEPIRLQPVASP